MTDLRTPLFAAAIALMACAAPAAADEHGQHTPAANDNGMF